MARTKDDGARRRARLFRARLCFICDGAPAAGPFEEVLAAALDGGVDVFQLRDKAATDAELLELAARARKLCRDAGALFIVNDRPAVAAAADADGVHLGQDDMPVAQARPIVGRDRVVGLSTHSPAQVDAAGDADYIGVGPVYPTPTKAGRPGVGHGLVRYADEHASVPFFAIGGIDLATVDAVVAAGARRVAVVRAIAEAEDPGAATRGLRAALAAGGHRAGSGVGTA
jgi:thiamine-phosphate pyrophosphorylase